MFLEVIDPLPLKYEVYFILMHKTLLGLVKMININKGVLLKQQVLNQNV